MEKQSKPKNRLLKFLPRAASAVTFQNPAFSPGRDKRSDINVNKFKTHAGRGYSGPIISIIPAEARRKSKNSSFVTQEPTSPKVSCMGQIKHKKKKIKKSKHVSLPKDFKPSLPEVKNHKTSIIKSPAEVKKKSSTIRNIFSSKKSAGGRKSDASADQKPALSDRTPSLSQMKRFASGRDTFANFDWTAQITPAESDHRDYYSDEERGDCDGEEEEEEIIIPFSAPILVSGGGLGMDLEPKKEINLWKRRTMAQPKPLQLNVLVRSI